MNWDIFSTVGYASIAVWLCVPLLWLVHALRRPRRWLCHVALLLCMAAFVLAKVNSNAYVNLIQVDRSKEIAAQLAAQLARQQAAKQEATAERSDEAAQVRYAEDDADDHLDEAGMDESELKYMRSFDENKTPEWKQEKKERSSGSADDSLESQIGASDEQQGMDSPTLFEEMPHQVIMMSSSDKLLADRCDSANLMIIRILMGLGVLVIVVDYLRRANVYDEAYFPLPLPSSWRDTMTPRNPVTVRSESPRRTLLEELRLFARRGESFVYLTDDVRAAAEATTTAYRLPLHWWPVDVLSVTDDVAMDDDFVFETLWFGRNSIVVNSPERAEGMLERFMELLAERRATRAHTRQTVHVVWDVPIPISEETLHRLANLCRATGFTLLLCRKAGSV